MSGGLAKRSLCSLPGRHIRVGTREEVERGVADPVVEGEVYIHQVLISRDKYRLFSHTLDGATMHSTPFRRIGSHPPFYRSGLLRRSFNRAITYFNTPDSHDVHHGKPVDGPRSAQVD